MFWNRQVRGLEIKLASLEKLNRQLYKKQFREGDKVYITDGSKDQLKAFYLRKSYNGGDCYYITANKEDTIVELISFSVSILNISHDKPVCCATCNQQL